eukprot:9889685-Karenia_brevis.AAC.1
MFHPPSWSGFGLTSAVLVGLQLLHLWQGHRQRGCSQWKCIDLGEGRMLASSWCHPLFLHNRVPIFADRHH